MKSLNRLVFLLNNCDIPMKSMLTITMPPPVFENNTIPFHLATLKAALQKLRRDGVNQYTWVREFQENDSIHWHVFTDLDVAAPGEVNRELSKHWCRWMIGRYSREWIDDECSKNMITDGKDGFVGCCRFEQLRGDAGGRYAGKEGSKRFQKKAESGWEHVGRWWGNSRNMKCTEGDIKRLSVEALEHAEVKINGKTRHIPYRVQFGKGSRPNG